MIFIDGLLYRPSLLPNLFLHITLALAEHVPLETKIVRGTLVQDANNFRTHFGSSFPWIIIWLVGSPYEQFVFLLATAYLLLPRVGKFGFALEVFIRGLAGSGCGDDSCEKFFEGKEGVGR